jgi:hypothetical protein
VVRQYYKEHKRNNHPNLYDSNANTTKKTAYHISIYTIVKAPPHVSFTVPKLVSPKEIRGWRGLRRKDTRAYSGTVNVRIQKRNEPPIKTY